MAVERRLKAVDGVAKRAEDVMGLEEEERRRRGRERRGEESGE
jgi:hypothetical protein